MGQPIDFSKEIRRIVRFWFSVFIVCLIVVIEFFYILVAKVYPSYGYLFYALFFLTTIVLAMSALRVGYIVGIRKMIKAFNERLGSPDAIN